MDNQTNHIDEELASLDDEFWAQKELEEQELWERHEKGLDVLGKMLDEYGVPHQRRGKKRGL